MKKQYLLLAAVLFLCLGQITAQQTKGKYGVQVGAFIQSVPSSYFHSVGTPYLHVDQNDIYRYYLGNYNSLSEAEQIRSKASSAGFNAFVIDFEDQAKKCALSCAIPTYSPAPSYLESIFFDFDQSYLRSKSKIELDKLIRVLNENPTYTTELRAHTDAKGTNPYNDNLSMRRAESAKKYLLKQGVAQYRIVTSTYGEEQPIARNELSGGTDSPEGRQLNRRVELVVKDANGGVVELVKEISIPSGLSYTGDY